MKSWKMKANSLGLHRPAFNYEPLLNPFTDLQSQCHRAEFFLLFYPQFEISELVKGNFFKFHVHGKNQEALCMTPLEKW